jgi:hypothetical protein
LGYGIETVQIIPFGLGRTPLEASVGSWQAASRAMTFPAAARRITLLRAAGAEPVLAASVTLRLLLKIATLCAPGPWVSLPARPKDNTLGMTILKSTFALADTLAFDFPPSRWDSAAAHSGSSRLVAVIKPRRPKHFKIRTLRAHSAQVTRAEAAGPQRSYRPGWCRLNTRTVSQVTLSCGNLHAEDLG